MQFYTMDTVLTEIYNIRNITYIEIKDLTMLKNDSSEMLIPFLSVTYDGGKSLSLSSRDKYFNTFVQKVVQVYNDEKNNIMEDSLTDPFKLRTKIKINDRTKRILESGKLENISSIYEFYDGKMSYSYSLLLNIDEVKLLVPILKYHLGELFSNTDKKIMFDDSFSGYKNRYIFNGKIDNLNMQFPVYYEKCSDNEYVFMVSNLLDSNYPVKVSIKFFNDRILVLCMIDEYELVCEFTYLITNDMVKMIVETKKEGKVVSYVNTDLPECINEYTDICNFDSEQSKKWFKLPFGGYYGISSLVSNISEIEKNVEISNMYLLVLDNSFMRREYYSKSYRRDGGSQYRIDDMTLDEAIKNTLFVCLSDSDNIYLVETLFLDSRHTNGYYDEKMKNRYFYHVLKSENGMHGIDKDKLMVIDYKDGILESSDLFNNHLVMKRINRGDKR